MDKDTETHIFVKDFVKVYPERIRVMQYKHGYYKRREGVTPRDLWLDPRQYDDYILSRRKRGMVDVDGVDEIIEIPDDVVIPPEQLLLHPAFKKKVVEPYYKRFEREVLPEVIVNPLFEQIRLNEALEHSRRRSKMMVNDLIACNDFDMFITFTFGEHHYDIDKCRQTFLNWIKDQQKQHILKGLERFSYVVVIEFHKDKKAIHFHGVFNNYKGKIVISHNEKTGKPVVQKGKVVYNVKSYKAGFTNLTYIVHKGKMASYVSKYITKEMAEVKGKKRYWASRDLKRPDRRYNQDYTGIDLIKTFETPHFSISQANVVF